MNTRRMTAWTTTLLTAAATTGCYSTWDVAPKALFHLEGFREGDTKTIQTADGDQIPFTSDTELHFRAKDGSMAEAQFRAIQVQDPIVVGIERKTGVPLEIDTSRLDMVQAKNFSTRNTALAITGVAITPGLLFLLALSQVSWGGRPLRIAGRDASVRASLCTSRTMRSHERAADDTTRARLFAYWAREASTECASIPAFLALARDLEKAGASRGLVNAARLAAREEANHTELCTALANEQADTPIGAIVPPTPASTDRDARALLERLVLEAFWDGCVAEGTAAAMARRTAELATDAATRLALQTIARDEQNHAELAREILAFGLSAGGRDVRHALMASFEHKRAAEEAAMERDAGDTNEIAFDEDAARRYGLANQTITRAARAEVWEKSVALLALV